LRPEVRSQESEVRNQKSEVRSQESEIRSCKPGASGQRQSGTGVTFAQCGGPMLPRPSAAAVGWKPPPVITKEHQISVVSHANSYLR